MNIEDSTEEDFTNLGEGEGSERKMEKEREREWGSNWGEGEGEGRLIAISAIVKLLMIDEL